MAKRFHSENIYSVNDTALYVIELHDADHGGASTEFKVTADGYQLRYDGQVENPFAPVMAAELSFSMYVQNATHAALITDLGTAADGRFKAKLLKDGNLEWAGSLVVDIGSYEDRDYPYTFTVRARDLAGLATVDYSASATAPHTGQETMIGHLVRALDYTGLPEFAWPTGTMLSTVVNWYEYRMPTGNDKDPMAQTRFDHRALYDIADGGKYNFSNALDVLRQIAQRFGAQLKQSGGVFKLAQVAELTGATPRQRHYDKDGTYLSNSAPAYTYDISGQDTDGARLAGGEYSWLAAVKEATETYRHRNWTNLIAGAIFDNIGGDFTGPTIKAQTIKLQVSLKINRTVFNNGVATTSNYYELFKVQIKVGNRWLRRDPPQVVNGSLQYPSAPTWSTSDSNYYLHTTLSGTYPPIGSSGSFSNQFDFATPPVLEDGELSVNVNPAGYINPTDGSSANAYVTAMSASGSIVVDDFATGTKATERLFRATASNVAATSTKVVLTSLLGDGPTANSLGKLQIWTGTVWADSALWTIGGSGTQRTISDLLLTQILAVQKSQLRTMRHTVGYAHGYNAHQRLDDGTNIWAFLGGAITGRKNDWAGTWYRVNYSITDIASDTAVEIPVGTGPVAPGPSGGISTSPSQSGPVRNPYQTGPTIPQSPDVPQGPTGQDASFIVSVLTGGIQTSTAIGVGAVTQVPMNTGLQAGAYQAGQVITVVDAINGTAQEFVVAADVEDGDTSISVTGYATSPIPPGAFVVSPQSNGTLAGTGTTDNAASSPWWSIFAQHWTIDNTNEFPYPIESPDVVFETSENAGNGSTAGLRFDGDGMQSWTASSATAGVKVGTDGKLYLANLDTATGTVGLVLESGYVKQKTLPTAGVTDHGALTGLGDDDHSIYALLAGRASGQNIIGGTGSGENLGLKSTSHGTTGYIIVLDDLFLNTVGTGTGNQVLILESGVVRQKTLSVITAHSGLSGLSADDHMQYARLNGRSGGQAFTGGTDAGNSLALQSTTNASRGVITMVDQVQLSNVPTGTGTAGLIIEAGVIKQKTLPTVITAHSGLTNLSNDDHSIYALLAGRSTGQTLIGAISMSGNLTLQSTTSATRGNIIVADQLQLNTVNLAGSSVTQALFLDSGVVKYRTVDNKEYVHLVAVPKGTAVTQTSGFDFNSAVWLVPNGLNGASITRVDYALLNNTSTTGSLTVGLDHYNTTNGTVASNILSATFNTSAVRANNTSTQVLTAGHWMVVSVSSSAGTLNGTVEGLLITIEITK
jgi:hypothetical protein